ncbi:MAG: response regulator transcription factor [Gammaproteobacteria bacterium]|nr:response regulator transcription factor [Gammaproteobacteria bacterium]MDH5275245.1 response regulator transcription factor [Gammaproteobacteria bacterium]
MRLLIVEDDAALRQSLAASLRSAGFAVDEASTAAEAEYFAAEFAVQIAIVDLGLPDRSGVELISRLRASGCEFPILILTAREHWQDKVNGLNAGADDYVVKPFNLDELKARINALMRRTAGQAQPILRAGSVEMNTHAREVRVEGRVVTLTAYEYRILEMLIMRAGRVVSKQELTDQLYDQDFERDSNVVEVLLTRLRKKLDPDRALGLIETVRGQGYRMPRAPDGGD